MKNILLTLILSALLHGSSGTSLAAPGPGDGHVVDIKPRPTCHILHNIKAEKLTEISSFKVNDVPLRIGPGVRFCRVRGLKNARGMPVNVIGKFQRWRLVIFESKTYWVHVSLSNSTE